MRMNKKVGSRGQNLSCFSRGSSRKKGEQKYAIIISLITGLLILTISLFWIFGEFFDEGELDWEVCRQSILLRSSIPEADLKLMKTDAKGAFPLKCKTEVVTIEDVEKSDDVYKKVADAVAAGWYMFGEGKLDFVHRDSTEKQTVCMAFARIHFDDEAIEKSNVGPLSREGFVNYYNTNRVENSEGTYGEYLPILEKGPAEGGNFIINKKGVNFDIGMDKDYLLVYRINKRSGFSEGWPGTWLYKVGYAVNLMYSEDDAKEWQDYRTIALASVDDLDVLECDKFLTVPA